LSIRNAIRDQDKQHPKVTLSECDIEDDLLTYNSLLVVPNDLELQKTIIDLHHSHPAVGHPGLARTFEQITRQYWWPGMRKTIAQYIRNCDTCTRSKPI
jgi:Integrase zinc binding domain